MPLIITNNATSLLSSSITAAQTTVSITNGDEGNFPTFVAGADQWHPLTVTKATGEREVMRCTARAGVNLTVVRGQENTTPLIFDAGQARVDVRLTAAAIAEIAIQDQIYSVGVDMSVGFKTASNRFAWDNSKTFGSGTEIASMDEFGNFKTNGTLTVQGAASFASSVYAANYIQSAAHLQCNGYFIGGGAVIMGPSVAGLIYLRPNGVNDGTGQFYVNTDGTAYASGPITSASNVTAAGVVQSGQHFHSTGVNSVWSSSGGASGMLYMWPRGTGDATGQAYLNASGDFTASGIIQAVSGHFHATGPYAILSAQGGASAGIYLRPNGVNSALEQTYVNVNGDIITGLGLYVGGSTAGTTVKDGSYLGYGMRTKAGYVGNYTSPGHWINFNWSSGTTFTIYVDASPFTFTTTACDYRIKREVKPLERSWDRIKALRPISYQHTDYELIKADDAPRWGFIAHEVQEALLPTAATGHKDAEELQSLEVLPIIAALTSALQEAMVRIEALEKRIA